MKAAGDKFVILSIDVLNSMVSIRVENTVRQNILIMRGEMPDKSIGILDIERCAEIYGGSVAYRCENKVVCCDILLNRLGEN